MQTQPDINAMVQAIRARTDFFPDTGLILGSGLGDYANRIQDPVVIPYADIPGFPRSTVEGHAGRFVLGEHKGRKVIAMEGRVHYYEGYSQAQLTAPVRIMHQLGVNTLLLTNAAGGSNTSFPVGTLMLLSDHINFSGSNPLIGPNVDGDGPRFPDMSEVYAADLRVAVKEKASAAGIPVEEGVYMMFTGPSYETPAEVRMAQILGADAVGMSTVPEAIVARHCGMRVLGISCVTNPAAGIGKAPLNHAEVVETTRRVKETFVKLVDLILAEVF